MSTASRDEVIAYVSNLLDVPGYTDYCVNGIQVEGRANITRIASAVSCSEQVFRHAIDQNVDLLLVHHGLFWQGSEPRSIAGPLRKRLALLLGSDINLAAYHLPLDGDARFGNNACIAAALDATLDRDVRFAVSGAHPVGQVAMLPEPISLDELAVRVARICGQHPTVIGAQLPAVSRVAICSGGGASYLEEAVQLGAQVLITGEAREHTMADATELGVAVIAAGHWATEVFGIRALGEHLADQFALPHSFISVPNPV